MADQNNEDVSGQDSSGLGGLGAMRLMMSGAQLPGSDQLNQLATQPVADPANKWLRYAAASLAPTKGGTFGESFSSALDAYAGANDHEAELRAKYLPIVAQALLQRQQMAITMQQNQFKLINEWDGSLKSGLTGLMSSGNQINPTTVTQTAQSIAQQKGIPPVYLQHWLSSLPTTPEGLKAYALQSTVSGMSPKEGLGVVTPTIKFTDVGGKLTPVNDNPNSQTPLGAMPGSVDKTLTPAERLPRIIETPQGQVAVNPANPSVTGRVGTPGADVAPPTGGNSGSGALSVDVTQDPAKQAADKKYAEGFAGYREALDDKVSSMADLNSRIAQMRQYANTARTGATADIRAKAGAFAKDLALSLGRPQAEADALGNGLAGGDLGASQAFQKLSVQGAMEALKGAMQSSSGAGAGRITQAEFAIFVKNNPSLETDPLAMEKIHNFIAEQYRKTLAEQDYVAREQDKGTPINTIRNNWAQEQGRTTNPPVRQTGAAKGTSSEPRSSVQLGITLSGKRMKLVNGIPEYE